MGIKKTTFYDPAARRRKILYVLCFLVVAGSAVAILLLAGKDPQKPRSEDREVAGGPGDTHPEPEPGGETSGPDRPEPPKPSPVPADPRREAMDRADDLYDTAMDLVAESMRATAGTPEAKESRAAALKALLAAEEAYEGWLADHPEDEGAFDRRLTEISKQLYWLRKSMTAGEFGPSGGQDESPPPEEPEKPEAPRPALPRAEPMRPGPTAERPPPAEPEFQPEETAARFVSDARRAFREGRPEDVVDAGRRLLEDERMAGHREEISRFVTAAEGMAGFLAGVREGLAARVNETLTLDLRNGSATGVLKSTEPEIVLETADGPRTIAVAALSAAELVSRARDAGRLPEDDSAAHRAAGGYLLFRRDVEEGTRELLLARAAGADVSVFEEEMEKALRRFEPLRALAAWLDLKPDLAAAPAGLDERIRAFRKDFAETDLFLSNREALFRAEAESATKREYEVEDNWSVPVKLGSRGQIQLVYDFESAKELADWGTTGEWEVEGGVLRGGKGRAWLARFDLENVDLSFTLPEGGPAVVGLWGRADAERRGVNLAVAPTEEGLTIALYHGDRKIAVETVHAPNEDLQIVLQKRDDKYQVRLGRRVVIKATDTTGRADHELVAIGIHVREGEVAIGDLEVSTTVDMEWAEAGGEKFARYLSDWFVTGPFPIDPKTMDADLGVPRWPEERPFDPRGAGPDGGEKPAWIRAHVDNGWLDLNRFMKPHDAVAGYAVARVWSPEKRSAILEVAVDDLARVWLNGEVVAKEVPLGEKIRVPIRLEEGDNVLLAKVLESRGGYWIRARLLTKDGAPMCDAISW